MDHLFSSPEKEKPKNKYITKVNGGGKNMNATLSSEEDMDIDEGMLMLNARAQMVC